MKENINIMKIKMGDLDINDSFFDGLKSDYDGFIDWFKRKYDKEAYCYFENNKLQALLFLKLEEIGDDNYDDINPNMKINKKLKISTLKVDAEHKKIGEVFMKIIFDEATKLNVDEIYVTLFNNNDKKKILIKYLEKFDFEYFGIKGKNELVYIRKIK